MALSADIRKARARATRDGWDGRWVKSEADAVAVLKHGCHFEIEKALRVRRFFENLIRHSKGEWGKSNQPFKLLDWQWLDVIAPAYGWQRPDGTRRYRRVHIEIPKKNGKSTMASGLSLYHLIADGESGAEVYNAACDRSQASIVFDESANMIRKSPLLLERIGERGIIDSRKTIVDRKTLSKYQALSADVPTKEGLNISALVVDELHAHKNRQLWNTLVYGGAARRQPMRIVITTAGLYDETSIGWQQHEYATQILNGTRDDFAFFAYIRAADEKADWQSPKVWERVNPSWGVTINAEEMAEECRAAQASVAEQNNFRRYRLNQWVQQVSRVVDLGLWDKGNIHPVDADALAGRQCYGGLDLSAISDLSAWALVFPCEDDPEAVDVLLRCWVPEAQLTNPKNLNAALYQQFEADGLLTVTAGNVIDYQAIGAQILADAEKFEIIESNVDKSFQGQQLTNELTEAGVQLFPFGHGYTAWAQPMKEFVRLYMAKKIHHGGNRLLRWAVENLSVKTAPNSGDMMPIKDVGKRLKIDPAVATIMGIDRRTRHGSDVTTGSVYDTRGIAWVA